MTSIPSPSRGVWYLGPFPLRAYGMFILVGILITLFWGSRRYRDRGGDPDLMWDVAIWALPAGIVGGRLYEVFTSPWIYFPPTGSLSEIPKVWNGGMGIMGAIVLGALAIYLVMRYRRARLGPFLDSIAPLVLLAQGLGRLGNYFNQELFGMATKLPWGLEIDDAHIPAGYPAGTLFHPTFLYELLWDVAGCFLLLWLSRRVNFKAGQVTWLYLVIWGLGRAWIENVRIDEPAYWVGPLRLASWFALGIVILGVVGYRWAGRVGAASMLSEDEVATWKRSRQRTA